MCHRSGFEPDWGRDSEELAEEVDAQAEEDDLPEFANEEEPDLEVLTDGGDE